MKYLNIYDYENRNYPFNIFIGGRGTGKTYSALSTCVNEGRKFILMRRTAQELDIMLDSEKGEGANPFKPINHDHDKNIGMRQIRKNLAGIYHRAESDNKLSHKGAPIGYGVALSTIASIRGVDFSDCTDLIYDEFIPEKHVRKLKAEGDAFLNAIETINRNRELAGIAPINVWLLANSNDIYNEIFKTLGLITDVEKMIRKKKEHKYYPERGLAIHLIHNNEEFVDAKSNTALYKLTKGTSFFDMALSNNFAYNDFSCIGSKNIKGYQPICAIGNAYIYRKKGTSEIYITYHKSKCRIFDSRHDQDVRAFMRSYGYALSEAFTNGLITFESYQLKSDILDIIY